MQRKLAGRSLEIGALLDKKHGEIAEFQKALQEEGMRKWQEFKSKNKAEVDALLEELGALENLDLKHYSIDGTYYEEHGLMFIVDNEEEPDVGGSSLQGIIEAAMALKGK